MRTVIFLVFVSIQTAGVFSLVQTAFSNDLQISFENEVAGISPDMTLLPKTVGSLDKPANKNSKAGATSKVNRFASAGFISNNMVPIGTVLKIVNDQRLATTGPELVFVDIGRRQGLEVGDKFTAYSAERFIYHPVLSPNHKKEEIEKYQRRVGFGRKQLGSHPGKPLGYRIEIRGILEITEVGSTTSYAKVLKAYEDIKPGELLLPYQENSESSDHVKNIDKSIEGYIVATKMDRIGVGVADIVYIDKGWDDDIRPGDHFEVYRIPEIEEKIWNKREPRKTLLLPYVLGELKVVGTQKNTATAIVVKSNYDMHVGNKIRYQP